MRLKLFYIGKLLLVFFLEMIAGLVTASLVGILVVPLAYQERGYWGIGGEWLLMLVGAILGFWVVNRVLFKRRQSKKWPDVKGAIGY